jgi:RNA polymerase sigma-70 factor (ECF subfamily)
MSREVLDAYEAALATLPALQQEAVVMRIEMGFTHREVAEALELPSANAARMMVARALVRIAEAMDAA